MTTAEWIWLIAAIAGLLVVGLSVLVGGYLLIRDWQESRVRRRQEDYQSPEPSAPEPTIQFGGRLTEEEPLPSPSSSDRIRWGRIHDRDGSERPSTNGESEANNGERMKCPICRSEISEVSGQIIKCPGCDSLYHQGCVVKMDNMCRNCGKEFS